MGKMRKYQSLPLSAGIKIEGAYSSRAMKVASILTWTFIIAVVCLIIFGFGGSYVMRSLALFSFMSSWLAVAVVRNIIARQTGYVLPWAVNTYYDWYLENTQMRQYGVKRAPFLPTIAWLTVVFGGYYASISIVDLLA